MEPFYNTGLRFESDKYIANVKCSIMIIHAENDNIVPYFLGKKVGFCKIFYINFFWNNNFYLVKSEIY